MPGELFAIVDNMIGRRVVLATNWANDRPFLRVRDGQSRASDVVPLIGLDLKYRAKPTNPMSCLGHHSFQPGAAAFFDCGRVPQEGKRKCRSCSVEDALNASDLHHTHRRTNSSADPNVAAHLQQPNELYLAAFRDGSVKVGTSTQRRTNTRLVEQGAWAARIVASAPDGLVIRRVEDFVTESLGISQSVSTERKIAGLIAPQPDKILDRVLASAADDIHCALPSFTLIESLDRAWRNPRSSVGIWSGLLRYPYSLGRGVHDLIVTNACGRLAIVNRPDSADRFVVDLGTLYGIELEFGDFGSQPIAIQDALF